MTQASAESIRILEVKGDCRRRRLALKTLTRHGYTKFARHVIEYNVPLFRINTRKHASRTKRYLMRDDMYNDSLLVCAIINKSVSSAVIHKLFMQPDHPRLATFSSSHIFDYPVEEFIHIHSSTPSTFVPADVNEDSDDDEDSVASSIDEQEDGLTYSQFLNDPYSILMALFIRRDIPLIQEILQLHPSFHKYLLGTFQLFLIDETAIEELKAISMFVHYKYAYDFAVRTFSDSGGKSVENRYHFLTIPPRLEPGMFYYFNPSILIDIQPPVGTTLPLIGAIEVELKTPRKS